MLGAQKKAAPRCGFFNGLFRLQRLSAKRELLIFSERSIVTQPARAPAEGLGPPAGCVPLPGQREKGEAASAAQGVGHFFLKSSWHALHVCAAGPKAAFS